ncbi:energy-coupling factor transporter transmembrane component T [Thermosulfurimonas sp.]|uniref:energy-coupling factor transporter transmembrane component T n=1 Tax=Thermosulfurimonas sp. TaxID=2080236 RepID=UPI0025EA7632|nr:energy-coupling factor transporter transmembrane component T [Thermosulfurimonas sp.]
MKNLHPYTKLVLSFLVSGLSVLLDQPLSLGLLALFSLGLFLLSRPEGRILKTHLFLALTTVWGIMISQGLFYQDYPRTVLFCLLPPGEHFSGLCFIKEGFSYGLIQSLRLLAALSAGLYLVTSTSRELFFRAVAALPLPRGLTLMAVSAVRFLPAVAENLRLVRQALRLRGYRPLRHGLLHTLRTELSVFYPLISLAVRQSRILADALLTRGFDPLSPGRKLFLPPWPTREKWLSAALLLLGLAVLAVKILFWLYLQEVFYAPTLRPLYALVRNYL